MSKKAGTLRVGITGCSAFLGNLSVDKALSFSNESVSSFYVDGKTSKVLGLSIISDSKAISSLYGLEDVFSSFTEAFWGTTFSTDYSSDTPLINNYHHSQTPVKYTRLDDITLTYTQDILTQVTRESGDRLTLEYDDDGQLVKTTDLYTGLVKDFSYSNSDLTGITVSKIV